MEDLFRHKGPLLGKGSEGERKRALAALVRGYVFCVLRLTLAAVAVCRAVCWSTYVWWGGVLRLLRCGMKECHGSWFDALVAWPWSHESKTPA